MKTTRDVRVNIESNATITGARSIVGVIVGVIVSSVSTVFGGKAETSQ